MSTAPELMEEIRRYSACEVLAMRVPEDLLDRLALEIRARMATGPSRIDCVRQVQVIQNWLGEARALRKVAALSGHVVGCDIQPVPYIIDILVEAYHPESAGVWFGRDAEVRLESVLSMDGDGLTSIDTCGLDVTKEGALSDKYLCSFDPRMPGIATSGGFVETLLRHSSAQPSSYRALRLRTDLLYSRAYHIHGMTRAYIRGPRGLSLTQLNDPNFPELPRGTVTEHRSLEARLGDTPNPYDRIEIMWSRRANMKTVVIEELVAADAPDPYRDPRAINRYMHAQWDPQQSHFVHFDGALRYYSRDHYPGRLGSDLRKFGGKGGEYKKLFRWDGEIPLPMWCDLVARFFERNDLILEYLGGPDTIE